MNIALIEAASNLGTLVRRVDQLQQALDSYSEQLDKTTGEAFRTIADNLRDILDNRVPALLTPEVARLYEP